MRAPRSAAARVSVQSCYRVPQERRAPAQAVPRGDRLRCDDDGHLATEMGRARERIAGSDFERETETLSGHHYGWSEHLWHVVEVAQQQHVVDAECEVDSLRQ